MIAYLATREQFLQDAPTIAQKVFDLVVANLNLSVEHEKQAWANSVGGAMHHVVLDDRFPKETGIAIEYQINTRKSRLDFVICGRDSDNRESLFVIELKQWSDIEPSDLDDHVQTRFRGRLTNTEHPSSQASGYAATLSGLNSYIQDKSVVLSTCAYLHNCEDPSVIRGETFAALLEKSPLFINGEKDELVTLIGKHIAAGEGVGLIQRIDAAENRPSKPLADSAGRMLQGHDEFVLIDEQKTAFETIIAAVLRPKSTKKQVLIIKGGPGTGKSVIAINALSRLVGAQKNVQYVTANAAPRDVFKHKLQGSIDKNEIQILLTGSTGFANVEVNSLDSLLVDEAHRLKERAFTEPGGTVQIRELINAARTTVFFLDEAQRVTWQDVGSEELINHWAVELGADIQQLSLVSQFRCNGSDQYLSWLDKSLGIQPDEEASILGIDYDFQVFNNPKELHEVIRGHSSGNNKSRMVAGYCWDWISKGNGVDYDIELPEFNYRAQWNLAKHGGTFMIHPDSVNEVGCIHTSQGLELDYVGVVIGPDLVYRDGALRTDPAARASTDASLHGFKTAFKRDPIAASKKADAIIRNTYRTLMSRGMKGCYIYCTDKETADYFRQQLPTVA